MDSAAVQQGRWLVYDACMVHGCGWATTIHSGIVRWKRVSRQAQIWCTHVLGLQHALHCTVAHFGGNMSAELAEAPGREVRTWKQEA